MIQTCLPSRGLMPVGNYSTRCKAEQDIKGNRCPDGLHPLSSKPARRAHQPAGIETSRENVNFRFILCVLDWAGTQSCEYCLSRTNPESRASSQRVYASRATRLISPLTATQRYTRPKSMTTT